MVSILRRSYVTVIKYFFLTIFYIFFNSVLHMKHSMKNLSIVCLFCLSAIINTQVVHAVTNKASIIDPADSNKALSVDVGRATAILIDADKGVFYVGEDRSNEDFCIQKNIKVCSATGNGFGQPFNFWNFPGGTTEQNETDLQTVLRELIEETGGQKYSPLSSLTTSELAKASHFVCPQFINIPSNPNAKAKAQFGNHFFFHFIDGNKVNEVSLSKACESAFKDKNSKPEEKEMIQFKAVPFDEIIRISKIINGYAVKDKDYTFAYKSSPGDNGYWVKTTEGKCVRLEISYAIACSILETYYKTFTQMHDLLIMESLKEKNPSTILTNVVQNSPFNNQSLNNTQTTNQLTNKFVKK